MGAVRLPKIPVLTIDDSVSAQSFFTRHTQSAYYLVGMTLFMAAVGLIGALVLVSQQNILVSLPSGAFKRS